MLAHAIRNPDCRHLTLVCLVILLIAGIFAHTSVWTTNIQNEDIYYSWLEGQRILNGENPYARILAGNMLDNDKYATYFPLFYELAFLTERAGLRDFVPWLEFWRIPFLAANLGIAVAIFWPLYRRRYFLLALFGTAFWLFNRWTMHVTQIAHVDFLAILPLLASLILLRRHHWLALLLFSLSLGIKQIAIFLAPFYLLWIWQEAQEGRIKRTVLAALVIASIPFVAALPFLAWNAEGFVRSVLFSVTRKPVSNPNVPSLDAMLGWIGIPARLPMLGLMAVVFLLAWRRHIKPLTSALLTMVAFADFSSVVFPQYFVWVVPLLPLAVGELLAVSASSLPGAGFRRTVADG